MVFRGGSTETARAYSECAPFKNSALYSGSSIKVVVSSKIRNIVFMSFLQKSKHIVDGRIAMYLAGLYLFPVDTSSSTRFALSSKLCHRGAIIIYRMGSLCSASVD